MQTRGRRARRRAQQRSPARHPQGARAACCSALPCNRRRCAPWPARALAWRAPQAREPGSRQPPPALPPRRTATCGPELPIQRASGGRRELRRLAPRPQGCTRGGEARPAKMLGKCGQARPRPQPAQSKPRCGLCAARAALTRTCLAASGRRVRKAQHTQSMYSLVAGARPPTMEQNRHARTGPSPPPSRRSYSTVLRTTGPLGRAPMAAGVPLAAAGLRTCHVIHAAGHGLSVRAAERGTCKVAAGVKLRVLLEAFAAGPLTSALAAAGRCSRARPAV